MRPNKSRSRNKSSKTRSNFGNIVNRVFDSSGPEGKVRGTPQQIIEKYSTLARDAQLSGDRINAENFLQHAEHYQRLLSLAQAEIAERQRMQEAQRAKHNAQRTPQKGESPSHKIESDPFNEEAQTLPKGEPYEDEKSGKKRSGRLVEMSSSEYFDTPLEKSNS